MTSDLNNDLCDRLKLLREQGLYRELRRINSPQLPHTQVDGRTLLNFSSNDYLGLANDPVLKEAAIKGIERYGAGSGASRLVCGSLAPHHELEQAIAAFKGAEAALAFSSGYASAVGTICALLDAHDVIVIDKRVHACIVDGARLCGAELRVFAHNDLDHLAKVLRWADRRNSGLSGKRRPRTLIVTESVFSMDGDFGLLRDLVELKEKHGAWLMVDEAHATGLYGEKRRGLAEEFGVAGQIEVQMGTLGKALGSAGGYICGSRTLIDYLVNRARSVIFSTAPVPAAVAAATAAVQLIQSDEGELRRNQLWARVDQVKNGLIAAGFVLPPVRSAIIPLVVGDEAKAVEAAAALREQGVLIPAIRYPTVAHGQARLRLTVSAAHAAADASQLVAVLSSLKSKI
ncbi:MAG: 8-amino-7-oxononanoate synthase [Verrucomicrobia bacterium]|nr:MAG: 8-amino-7-oxononanoate synthase [Verrucomicrobiota bacterium]